MSRKHRIAALGLSVAFPLVMAHCGRDSDNEVMLYDAEAVLAKVVYAAIGPEQASGYELYLSAPAGTAAVTVEGGGANLGAVKLRDRADRVFFKVTQPVDPVKVSRLNVTINGTTHALAFEDKNAPKPPKLADDVYLFPFEPGKSVLYGQGPNGNFSHRGQNAYDFVIGQGTPIVAARAGRVSYAVGTNADGGSPNVIVVEQDNGTKGIYLHMMQGGVLVKAGDEVKVGQVIAKVGNTGFSTEPHLHYQVDRPDRKIELLKFLTSEAPQGATLTLQKRYQAPSSLSTRP